MTLRNGFPSLHVLFIALLCFGVCFCHVDLCNWKYDIDGVMWCSQGRDPVIPLPADYPYPTSDDTYRDQCVILEDKTSVTSIYSTRDCLKPIVGKLKPGQTSFFVGGNNERNISVAFNFQKLPGWTPGAMVHYVFGDCDVILQVNNEGAIGYDYAIRRHPIVDFSNPLTTNEELLNKSIAIGPQGLTLSTHTGRHICYRPCNALNPDGSINFTQVVVKGTPAIKLSYISLGPETNPESIFVKDDGSPVIPTISIASPKPSPLPETKYAEVKEQAPPSTVAPSSTEIPKPKDKFPKWAMILLIVLGAVLGLLLLIIIPAVVAFCLCKKPPTAKAASETSNISSTRGTVKSQMTTAGSTMNDEQINVVVQN